MEGQLLVVQNLRILEFDVRMDNVAGGATSNGGQKIKEKFWRREADFINDDEDEEEGEGGNSSGGESEALEGNERAVKDPFKPLEMGRMNDKEWEIHQQQIHSETQRLLRKQQVALPCRKQKTLELGDVLSKIQRRCHEVSAEKSQPAEPALPMAEVEPCREA